MNEKDKRERDHIRKAFKEFQKKRRNQKDYVFESGTAGECEDPVDAVERGMPCGQQEA